MSEEDYIEFRGIQFGRFYLFRRPNKVVYLRDHNILPFLSSGIERPSNLILDQYQTRHSCAVLSQPTTSLLILLLLTRIQARDTNNASYYTRTMPD